MLLKALWKNVNEANKIAQSVRGYPCSNRVLRWGLFFQGFARSVWKQFCSLKRKKKKKERKKEISIFNNTQSFLKKFLFLFLTLVFIERTKKFSGVRKMQILPCAELKCTHFYKAYHELCLHPLIASGGPSWKHYSLMLSKQRFVLVWVLSSSSASLLSFSLCTVLVGFFYFFFFRKLKQ